MSYIPGLNHPQAKAKSKASRADGRQCQVIEGDQSRCVVSFTLRGATQRAVLPLDRLYSEEGPCAHLRPPVCGEKLFCDMTPVDNKTVNAQWLVAFAWRGKLESAPRSGPLSAVTGMVAEVGTDSGVLLFVTPAGCRERCALGRAAVQPDGAPLPAAEPISNHLDVGDTVVFDCRPTTTAANCHWLADKVWFPAASEDSYYEDEDCELPGGERGEFILRTTLKAIVGRVDLVVNYKAVLTFDYHGQRERALLLTGKYTFPEKATAAERRDLTKVLSRGDQVRFTCHEYDKPNGTDRCGWWVMEAVRLETTQQVGREAGYSQSGHLYEKIGTVKDVLAAEGLLHFVLAGRREVAWFSDEEVFINGRPCAGRLSDTLESGQRVHFNAVPGSAPRGADWRCTCVWRGEMPTVEASQKRTEASVVKKQKKSKSAKSRIDDLDDFELPAAPPSAGGDGWAVPMATGTVPPLMARPHLGGGDRGPRADKQTPRLRASMVAELDAFDTGMDGGAGGGSDAGAGADWMAAVDGNAEWDEEVEPDDDGDELLGRAAPAGSASSGPSRPLSEASPEQPGPVSSPSRAARPSAADPARPPLLPDPEPRRSPLLPTPDPLASWSPAGLPHGTPASAARAQGRSPPGLSAPRPANPPGLSPAALAAAASANYSRQQAAASSSLLGTPPVPHRDGLLPAPPLPPAFYGYPAGQPAYWPPGLALGHPHLAHQPLAPQQLLFGGRLPPPAMAPLSVDQESLERMVRGGPLPTSAVPPAPSAQQKRSVPDADWEAAAAAFKVDPAPAPPPPPPAPAQQPESSPTLESLELRHGAAGGLPGQAPGLDSVSDRLAAVQLGDDVQRSESGTEGSLDDELDRLETGPADGGDRSPPPPVEPVSGKGQILAFVDESQGLAEWDHDGTIEQVMFDRAVCYWLGARMDTLDLTDCYTPGADVSFECIPAGPGEPYQWVATHFEQIED
ncbi:uncharacterized protein LOC122382682 [Amphibalanus amphitrite]|uniref:uncharacterized protein LOC122382682 n=1 Tax=Amphibalanus amphitrite TaxID=1232801 RepID=UPI001C90D981|nr:uncharacterized protein LOC122382682 [Amphibalanus amphitrite]